MLASCLLFTGIDQVTFGSTVVPDPTEGEVLIETWFSCVSPGTELRCLAGRQEHIGRDHFPFIPGYALVGRVVIADRAGRCPTGTVVFCTGTRHASHSLAWGGHVSHAVAPAGAVVPLPGHVDPVEASLLKLAAIAHRGVLLARPRPTEAVAVLGLGPIGQLSARLFRLQDTRVVAADVVPARVAVAAAAGLETVLAQGSVNDAVRARLPEGADVVVDATGHPDVLRDAIRLVRDRPWTDPLPLGGQLVVQGSYAGDTAFPQDLAFSKELRAVWPRDCLRSDLEAVLDLLSSGRLAIRDLVGEPHPVSAASGVYAALQRHEGDRLTAAFDWRSLPRP